jgi:pyruvate formate lyase activating enzyme
MSQARIHSLESFGTVDGPGIRFIIFLQGCPLRCLYCHNPDSWEPEAPEKRIMTDDELFELIVRQRNFYQPRGGVTFSGGEPLMQLAFLRAFTARLKAEGFHTAIDTSGFLFSESNKAMTQFFAEEIDLTLLDIKAFNEDDYKRLTGARLQPTLDLAAFLARHQRPVWVRYVVVPGYTDNMAEVARMAEFVGALGNVEMVEVLPFHKIGEFKWHEMKLEYKLGAVPACPPETAQAVKTLFQNQGLNVH